MRFKLIRTLFFALALIPTVLMAQGRRIDTTMKVGKAGFRINCYNKSSEKNPITIYPVGFESEARDFSFELKGGIEAGKKFLDALEVCTRAVSLGTVDTLVSHPASMTHASIPREQRIANGLSDGLIRLSVGIEDADDLIADLAQAIG